MKKRTPKTIKEVLEFFHVSPEAAEAVEDVYIHRGAADALAHLAKLGWVPVATLIRGAIRFRLRRTK